MGEKPPTRVACVRINADSFVSFDFVYSNLLAALAVDDPDALATKISIGPNTVVAGETTRICVESMIVTV